MLIKDIKYSYNDVMVIPAKVSTIEHRSECETFHKDGFLPISLGPRILRTELAPVYIMSAISYEIELGE